MPRPKYPLTPLLEHRARAVDARTDELAGAVRAREAAEAVRVDAERARARAEEAVAAARAAEDRRLAAGELRAVDLARVEAWEIGARAEVDRLAAAARAAEAEASRRLLEQHDARSALAGAMANRDVVAKDRDRFEASVARRILSAEEEAAAEAWSGRPDAGSRR